MHIRVPNFSGSKGGLGPVNSLKVGLSPLFYHMLNSVLRNFIYEFIWSIFSVLPIYLLIDIGSRSSQLLILWINLHRTVISTEIIADETQSFDQYLKYMMFNKYKQIAKTSKVMLTFNGLKISWKKSRCK